MEESEVTEKIPLMNKSRDAVNGHGCLAEKGRGQSAESLVVSLVLS